MSMKPKGVAMIEIERVEKSGNRKKGAFSMLAIKHDVFDKFSKIRRTVNMSNSELLGRLLDNVKIVSLKRE